MDGSSQMMTSSSLAEVANSNINNNYNYIYRICVMHLGMLGSAVDPPVLSGLR